MLTVFLTACATERKSNDSSSKQPTSSNSIISEQLTSSLSESQALELVKSKITNSKNTSYLKFEPESMQTIDGKEYYCVHVYSESSTAIDSNGDKQIFTFGWYFVDKSSGETYQDDSGGAGVNLKKLD